MPKASTSESNLYNSTLISESSPLWYLPICKSTNPYSRNKSAAPSMMSQRLFGLYTVLSVAIVHPLKDGNKEVESCAEAGDARTIESRIMMQGVVCLICKTIRIKTQAAHQ